MTVATYQKVVKRMRRAFGSHHAETETLSGLPYFAPESAEALSLTSILCMQTAVVKALLGLVD
jgi:hypothetical protein